MIFFRFLSNLRILSIRQLVPNSNENFLSLSKNLLYINEKVSIYSSLTKLKLSTLVALTSLTGSMMLDPLLFSKKTASVFFGTLFSAFSASCLNQLIEANYDRNMIRTQKRPIASGRFSEKKAFFLSLIFGLLGTNCLLFFATQESAILAFSNIVIYAFIYTPLKRYSHYNTIVGAIVGGIPPLIGVSAFEPLSKLTINHLFLPIILFLWQFPHFNSLSYLSFKDYLNAGYRMAVIKNIKFLKFTTISSSILIGLLSLHPRINNNLNSMFICDSLTLNSFLIFFSLKYVIFHTKTQARQLFRYSLFYMPVFMVMLILHKKHETKNKKNI